jgi:hypothetical protein
MRFRPVYQGSLMTSLEKQIELLELQGNDAELLGLLTYDPATRARCTVLADRLRLLAIELREKAQDAYRRPQLVFDRERLSN